ncbi:CoA-transferase [Pseudonocardia xishanensis]|uniref:Uncharacterized protein n=1 Tax=Pseudonocardia xishanensis TaxID=630995 RepID=A0ABP8S6D2_9PSEU
MVTAEAALSDIHDGATPAVGGFGLCGNPSTPIATLHRSKVTDLKIVSDNCVVDDWGLGILLADGRISRVTGSCVLLTGEVSDARRATEVGLLTRAAADVDAEVARYVEMLRLGAPAALAETKDLPLRERPASMSEDLAEMNALSARYFAGEGDQERSRALAEKSREAPLTSKVDPAEPSCPHRTRCPPTASTSRPDLLQPSHQVTAQR